VFGKFLCQLLPIDANEKRKNTPSMDETHNSEKLSLHRRVNAKSISVDDAKQLLRQRPASLAIAAAAPQ